MFRTVVRSFLFALVLSALVTGAAKTVFLACGGKETPVLIEAYRSRNAWVIRVDGTWVFVGRWYLNVEDLDNQETILMIGGDNELSNW